MRGSRQKTSMALIVHKYGGTSMGSTERIRNVAKRVAKWARAGHQNGADVPKPYAQVGNAVLMEYLGDLEEPAPRLDSVRLQIDGQLVTHHIYSAKELEALRKGGVQRIYLGNVATGDHQLEVLVDAKLEDGKDFSRTEHLTFRKEVKPKLVGLTLAGSGNTPIALGDW